MGSSQDRKTACEEPAKPLKFDYSDTEMTSESST